MPDDFDYQWLRDLLARPEKWTEDDASAVRLMIANQEQAIAAMHPKDTDGRRSAQGVVDELTAALRTYLAGRAKPG
jgi:hypothetical protein